MASVEDYQAQLDALLEVLQAKPDLTRVVLAIELQSKIAAAQYTIVSRQVNEIRGELARLKKTE